MNSGSYAHLITDKYAKKYAGLKTASSTKFAGKTRNLPAGN
jgi:hypothetical protein